MTADLIAFLRARLDEDAAAARATHPVFLEWEYDSAVREVRDVGNGGELLHRVEGRIGAHIARHDPARVLREVEAKRRIIVRYEDQAALHANRMGGILTRYLVQELLEVVRALALPYDDHPDYREEFRP